MWDITLSVSIVPGEWQVRNPVFRRRFEYPVSCEIDPVKDQNILSPNIKYCRERVCYATHDAYVQCRSSFPNTQYHPVTDAAALLTELHSTK